MMKACRPFVLLWVVGAFLLSGCEGPPIPQEVGQAEHQELDLWRIGGPLYAPQEYQQYRAALGTAREDLLRAKSRFILLRDFGEVQAEFQALLKAGEELRVKIEVEKQARAQDIESQLATCRTQIAKLRQSASTINEGYLTGKPLTKAELALAEASQLSADGKFEAARERVRAANGYLQQAQEALAPITARYRDRTLQAKWQHWVTETVADSQRRGKIAIVVSKIDRLMYLYRKGALVKTYPVGIGRSGLSMKVRAGDSATPEGRYAIIQKRPHSKYYKALLINYPNEEDRKVFREAKQRGQIPRSIGIGGLVEIHGGGKDGMTLGCIALDNDQMSEVFDMVEVGTPVTIVGSTGAKNAASPLAGL